MASGPQDFPFDIMDVVELLHLKIRRRQANSVYVDCPFCGDKRGKMNVNSTKNVWRCNYCDEHGGMLALYAKVYGVTNSDAYREICDALQTGSRAPEYKTGHKKKDEPEEVAQSDLADIQDIHQTLSLLFGMLSLTDAHHRHLQSEKRGLNEEQIERLGYKSIPPPYLCRSLTKRLIAQGCTVQGVPGFYLGDDGEWTVKFYKRTSGILIPSRGVDGLIRGAQILLDTPIRDENDLPGKAGTKYLWLSSSTKNMGVTSGSPVHFVGDPFARTVYVTEGLLKADIAHCLMNRSFVAIAGANNVSQLDPLFGLLAQNGTELVVEAHDMDKYRNDMISKGASSIYLMARRHGMDSRRLTWNPNYKGIDDWQLALRRKKEKEGQNRLIFEQMTFKEKFAQGLCAIDHLGQCVEVWHSLPQNRESLTDFLGLTEQEYEIFTGEGNAALEKLLNAQRRQQKFRIYQLKFTEDVKTKPFAFLGIEALHKAGYEQPPAADYQLVCDTVIPCPDKQKDEHVLARIFNLYNDTLPQGYHGRSVSSSDVMELFNEEKRCYFYVDCTSGLQFVPVRFSPFLATPMTEAAGT